MPTLASLFGAIVRYCIAETILAERFALGRMKTFATGAAMLVFGLLLLWLALLFFLFGLFFFLAGLPDMVKPALVIGAIGLLISLLLLVQGWHRVARRKRI